MSLWPSRGGEGTIVPHMWKGKQSGDSSSKSNLYIIFFSL